MGTTGVSGYWSGVARRKLEDSGARYLGDGLAHSFTLPSFDETRIQLETYFWDSVYCALTHKDPATVLRATLQVYEYVGRLGKSATCHEAQMACRERVEGLMKT